jgi:hypothetical protein
VNLSRAHNTEGEQSSQGNPGQRLSAVPGNGQPISSFLSVSVWGKAPTLVSVPVIEQESN